MAPDVWVMFRPGQAYAMLAGNDGSGARIAFRRPVRLLFVLAIAASLLTSRRISLRLIVACAECALFLPLLLVASAALARGRTVSLARAIDLFFMSLGPWMLWLFSLTALWAFLPAERAYELLEYRWIWYWAALVAFVWSCVIDFWFLRRVCAQSAVKAILWLTGQRLIVWIAGLAIFLGGSGWQVLEARFGW
ncbi:MAG TPA: hypothetical protein VML19_10425 [Verrucomicrobiae bacterium]|nr:hypothetical protein [Verrucomicrobiae bacterium]